MFLFGIYFTQAFAYTTVILNQQQQWQTSDNVTVENIYYIPRREKQQYYVNVSLEQQDIEFYLIVTQDQQFSLQNNVTKPLIDWVSQIENRLTRFIRFISEGKDIFITTIGNITQKYNISVVSTNNDVCPNDCNNNGICLNNECKCKSSYIGSDCHQEAQEIFLNQINQFSLKEDQLTYFYITVEEQKHRGNNFTLFLKVMKYMNQSNSSIDTQFFIERTQLLYLPYNSGFNNLTVFNSTKVNVNNPRLMSILIDENKQQPLVFVALSKNQNSTFTIRLEGKLENDGLSDEFSLIMILVGSGYLLLTIILGYLFLRRRKNKEEKKVEINQDKKDTVEHSTGNKIQQAIQSELEGLNESEKRFVNGTCQTCYGKKNSHDCQCKR